MTKVLEKNTWIKASPQEVYRCFTEKEAMLTWHGKEVELNPVPGGIYHVVFENGDEILGEFKELEPYKRILYSANYWGIKTLVEVKFTPEKSGTNIQLRQEFEPDVDLSSFKFGWDYFIGRLEKLWT